LIAHPTNPSALADSADITTGLETAVVGLSCRFPGAPDADRYWRNLRAGIESITVFSPEELATAGVPEVLRNDPNYVPAQGVLDGADQFDADFFGVNPKEADMMDPQHRVLLECAWEALENAGYDPKAAPGPVGVYAGSYYNTYVDNLVGHTHTSDPAEVFTRNIANEKDYLATRIAYKLALSGPAMTVQTACSTSLVAVHLACQALLSGACDTALAGGVTVRAQQNGYIFQPSGIFSSDGHCRPFDAAAEGTVAANGAGVVVLRRLEDALADGDPIRAVIRGSAVGNDGAERVGFTAPGVAGQARVIQAALIMAEVDPATVTYVEAHGSGTPVGDPIEVEALTRVFGAAGAGRGTCAIGSVKSNIGHTHAAAGVAGLIKTILALQNGELPPSLHFDRPNPAIAFGATPFYVNTSLTPWRADGGPRRAGVSSFGMGGTGAHVVLEEAPAAREKAPARRRRMLPLSARSETALESATDRLAAHLGTEPGVSLASVARTLQSGRRHFAHRRFLVAGDSAEAATALRERNPRVLRGGRHDGVTRPVAFLFPGLGEQRPGMGRELYDGNPVFRAEIDRCTEGFRPHLGLDLRTLLYPPRTSGEDRQSQPDLRRMLGRGPASGTADRTELDHTQYAQPATFAVEYALARLWQSWGVRPDAMIGYSIGEYVAACLSGVLSVDDALLLVAHRARLIEGLPGGAMLAVPLSEQRVRTLLGDSLSLAAVNGPELCVVAGDDERIGALERQLGSEGVAVRRLRTTHAFHSHMMAPIAEEFTELVAGIRLDPPCIPYVSNVTGDWITPDQALDPSWWTRHVAQPVRFGDGVSRLWQEPGHLLLEVGPGQSLGSLALQARPAGAGAGATYASLPGEYDRQSEENFLLNTAGKLWVAGVDLDWDAVRGGTASRTPLPTYPFERRRHWVDPAPKAATALASSLAKKADLADWFHVPVWEPLAPHPARRPPTGQETGSWLLFLDDHGIGSALAQQLVAAAHQVTTVRAGDGWRRTGEHEYEIAPGDDAQYQRLVEELGERPELPTRVVHLWNVGPRGPVNRMLERGFSSLVRFNKAVVRASAENLDLVVLTSDAHAVLGTADIAPEKATAIGPCLVLPLEQPNTGCRGIDISLPVGRAWSSQDADRLLAELLHPSGHALTALRGRGRWQQSYRPVRLEAAGPRRTAVRPRGVYLITGGFGGVGLTLARYLADAAKARLVLVSRGALPPPENWDAWLSEHASDDARAARIRAVRELEALGAEVMVASGDVTDQDRMTEIADEIVARFGAVHGIVHAAGVPASGLAQLKDVASALAVLAPKVQGGLVVDALARRLTPDFTVLCSSALALTGGVGQIDYVAANAFLDALAQHNDATGGPVTVSINWDGWQEVGMAVHMIGMDNAPPTPRPSRTGPVEHPLLTDCRVDDDIVAVYSVSLTVANSWLIDEHRMVGSAVVPGTGHLELVRAAYEHQSGGSGTGVELCEVTFLSPVVIGEDQHRELRVVLEKDSTPVQFAVVSRQTVEESGPAQCHGHDDEGWQVHVTGEVGPAQVGPDAAQQHDVAALIADAGMRDLGSITHTGPMGFGPRSRCLRRVHLGETEALAELELPGEFASDLEHIRLHPSLLDLAAGFHGMNLAEEFRIPLSYGRLTLLAPLPRRIFSHHRFHEMDRAGKETFTADFTLMDERGNELARIENFVLKRVTDLETRLAALRDGTSTAVAPYRFATAGRARGAAAVSGPGLLQEHLKQGILPEEGVEAFLRVLESGVGPRVAIVTKNLDAALADIARSRPDLDDFGAPARVGGIAHPRPGVLAPYQAPGDEVETRLATLWAQLLGLEKVGVHDDFFELGGHSLLGLQVVARIRRQFDVDLPLSVLFEALTVAELATVLRPQLALFQRNSA